LPLGTGEPSLTEKEYPLEAAEEDGTLAGVASTWSADNDALYDGTSRSGVRVVTLAPVLKQRTFPLPELLDRLLALGSWGMGAAVEIEFAVTLTGVPRPEFALLQLRPMALSREQEELELDDAPREALLCHSTRIMGHGRLKVHDVVVVDRHRFDRSKSRETAAAIAVLNAELLAAGRPYLLVGVGRWGSRDPWLGIPVRWEQICGSRAIVEAAPRDAAVDPSQGTHFFQNLTSFHVGYFTVGPRPGDGFVDWDWLAAQPALREQGAVRLLRFDEPVVVTMDGRTGEGVIAKPRPR
ncbi:MAG TPA: histidine kinase, partial [Vicinamibacteria bacterium]|nr:histidine kinase [Vicinamibacteria bacterium]